MPSSCSQMSMERTKSKRAHIRSNSEASLKTEPRLSSFSSVEGTTDSWAVLDDGSGTAARKKVMVVVDHSRESRLAMFWALSHVVQRADTVALVQVLPPQKTSTGQSQGNGSAPNDVKEARSKLESRASELGLSLKTLCATRRPEVDIDVLLVEGTDKGPTIVSHAKKFEASVLILGQRKPTLLQRLFQRGNDAFVDYCIENAECLTVAIRKKSSGYLINSRWRKNFWLLA